MERMKGNEERGPNERVRGGEPPSGKLRGERKGRGKLERGVVADEGMFPRREGAACEIGLEGGGGGGTRHRGAKTYCRVQSRRNE